jgi:hypothetical protein
MATDGAELAAASHVDIGRSGLPAQAIALVISS